MLIGQWYPLRQNTAASGRKEEGRECLKKRRTAIPVSTDSAVSNANEAPSLGVLSPIGETR
jgi:hypothetical protein